MANPIADSAAATVKTNKENIKPKESSKYTEKNIKLMFTANKINSIEINITIIFFLFKKIPAIPNKNKKRGVCKKFIMFKEFIFFSFLREPVAQLVRVYA